MKSQKPVRAVDAGFRKAFLLLLGITVFRLVFSTHHELVPDEAYYWEWSRHLDFCYRDKGPMVAWAIAFGTWIAGDTVFGIRWIGILLAMGTSWQLYRLARRLFDEPTAWRVLLVSCVVPLLAVGAIVMTIDSLCVFFWAWSMNLAWTAFEKDRKRDWLLLGLGIGLGFLSKFTNVLQLVSVLGYWAWTPLQRQRFRWANLACLLVPFAACAALILFWNILHDWPNARALESRSGVELGFHLHPQELIKYLQEQLLVTSPFIYVGIGVAAVGLLLGRIQENRIRFLICDFFPITLCFLFFSLNVAGKGNWTAPALLSGLILLVVFWRGQAVCHRGWKWIFALALSLALAETVVLHETFWVHFPPKHDPLKRARGWTDLASHVRTWEERTGTKLILANHYSQASILAFYLPGQPKTYIPRTASVDDQYSLWPLYQMEPGTTALYVTDDPGEENLPAELGKQFGSVKLLEDFYTQHRGRPVAQFQIYLCLEPRSTP